MMRGQYQSVIQSFQVNMYTARRVINRGEINLYHSSMEENMIDQKLMDYFKFDQADLGANENGQFTEKQKERIFKEDKSNRKWSRIGGIVLIFIGAIGLFGAIIAGIGDQDPGFRIGFGIGFGVIWPLIWVGSVWP